MKTLLTFVLILWIFSSCEKNRIQKFVVGKDLGYDVQLVELQSTLKDTIVPNVYGLPDTVQVSELNIDLDNDGIRDLTFNGFVDVKRVATTVNSDDGFETVYGFLDHYKIYLSSMSNVKLSFFDGSEYIYRELIDSSWDFYGTFPRLTVISNFFYNSNPAFEKLSTNATVKYLSCGENAADLDFENNESIFVLVDQEYYEGGYIFTGNAYNDSLLGGQEYKEANIYQPDQGQIAYIPFKINKYGDLYKGWLEFHVFNNTYVSISKIALSKFANE
ncbi:MAG: hypothetical protein R2799_12190 [Crocinitomicaceae bacterium]